VYDQWNPVLVLDEGNDVQRKYTWGLDLYGLAGDGTVQDIHGAGGVGGLLSVVETQGTATTADDENYWFVYDGNGNVGQVLDATDTSDVSLAAHYEYDPYGDTLVVDDVDSSGYANDNPYRFSTKWLDNDLTTGDDNGGAIESSGLYYYGFRYYSPNLGRWLSRDPIKEYGGLNLHAFLSNNTINDYDLIGAESAAGFVKRVLGVIRAGARRGGRACTRIAGVGCFCVIVTLEGEFRGCCRGDQERVCFVGRFTVDVGIYACESLGGTGFLVPPFPSFQVKWLPAKKRPPAPIGGIHLNCPSEGFSGSVCLTASAGFSTFTVGARGCWDFGENKLTLDAGLGVGVGTGVSVGGHGTYTRCW